MQQVILVVDDEYDVAHTCARVLKRAGFDCLIAYDTARALLLFDSKRPALVLTDLHLANGDGFEIVRYVHQKSPTTPVILMTSYHNADLPRQVAGAGADRYLRKPFSNSELTTTVAALLGEPQRTD